MAKKLLTTGELGSYRDHVPRRKLLTTGELAEILGISDSTVRAWAREGVITPEFVTRGGHYRWIEQDVREQLRQAREREREQQDKD